MSDRTFDTEGDSPMPEALWWQAIERAINGPRGQAAVAALEVALFALPRHRLIEEDISDGRDVCALGALAYKRQREHHPNERPQEIIEGLGRSYGDQGSLGIWECGISLNLRDTVAWLFSYVNDDLAAGLTPEERWKFVMQWCRLMQGKKPLARYEVSRGC
jgi:hypothetical protein